MPDLPEEAVQAAADDLEEAFKNTPYRFWTCINKTHKYVTWTGDVASCDTCGLTSEMTGKRDVLVRADERRKTAEEIAAAIEARRCPMDRKFCTDCVCRPEDAALARQLGEARA
ncbi:hypothetical protein [Nonomuraea basaltis]|uniref:hypothetical protein n=1 Tax=Nonomuraea basaltis TaxID=2495887 RepID=UPI00110C6F8C|nr:hypothetical protein [Nonomuraea basaltis]TMS00151.1 hypothetical protein EJK15_03505 [Nonomuraea basaltis]